MNNDTLTMSICNKGFSGKSGVLHRIKFCVGGQQCSPQSLTVYSLDRNVLRNGIYLKTSNQNAK